MRVMLRHRHLILLQVFNSHDDKLKTLSRNQNDKKNEQQTNASCGNDSQFGSEAKRDATKLDVYQNNRVSLPSNKLEVTSPRSHAMLG